MLKKTILLVGSLLLSPLLMADPIKYPPNIFDLINELGKTESISVLTPQAIEISQKYPDITLISQPGELDMINIVPNKDKFTTLLVASDNTTENPTVSITYGKGELKKAELIYRNYPDISDIDKKEATATFKRLLIDALKDYGYALGKKTKNVDEYYENEYASVGFKLLGKKENYDLVMTLEKK